MKKEYVAPSVERLTFDYTENVVASGTPGEEVVEQEPVVESNPGHTCPTGFKWPWLPPMRPKRPWWWPF